MREDDFNYAIKINIEELQKFLIRLNRTGDLKDGLYDEGMSYIKKVLTLIDNKRKFEG